MFHQQIMDYDTETQQNVLPGAEQRCSDHPPVRPCVARLRANCAVPTLPVQEVFTAARQFQSLADEREKAQQTASAALEAAFDFMEQAFAESQRWWCSSPS